jgi:Flp pilus assembly protein TadD/CelD/BcsL family acetyltransferase involved in cellulose biosynthesis
MDGLLAAGANTLVVEEIDRRDMLDRIRPSWDHVYAADPESNFFLSPFWLWPWLKSMEQRWVILGVRRVSHPGAYVAFMPLQQRTHMRPKGGFYNELAMAGNRFADYTGLICHPEFASAAIPLIGAHIRQMSWRRITFEQVRMSEGRLALLLAGADAGTIPIQRVLPPLYKGIDNSVCPFVTLPDSFDAYLATLSANTRQKIRRVLRKVEGDPAFRFTCSTPETVERDVGLLLGLWDRKWRPQKGERTDNIVATMRFMLTAAGRDGALHLPMLWQGDVLLGALGNLIDPFRKEMLFLIAGRNTDADEPPPGIALHAYAIREAIERGFRIYDFLRGDEKYKFSFAQETHQIPDLRFESTSDLNHDGGLDRRSFRRVLEDSEKLVRDGKPNLAELGFKQLIEADPENAHALAGCAQLLLARGDKAGAEPLLVRALAKDREIAAAWRSYGQLRAGQGNAVEAVASFQQSLKLDRKSAEAWNGLAGALGRIGRHEDQIKAYDNAIKLNPSDRGFELNRANALFWQRRLPASDHARYSELNARFGVAHQKKGDLKHAAGFFRLALLLNERNIEARLALAALLEKKGLKREAEAHYRSVLKLRPREPSALQRLGAMGALKAPRRSEKAKAIKTKAKRARQGTGAVPPAG